MGVAAPINLSQSGPGCCVMGLASALVAQCSPPLVSPPSGWDWCWVAGAPQPCLTLVHEEDEAVVYLGLGELPDLSAGC